MISRLNLTALVTIMLSMGLQVNIQAVLTAARPARRVAFALLANDLLVPAVTFGLLYVFQADPMVAVGLLVLAVCPGAPVGPPITAVARGSVPLAIAIMVILAGLSGLLSPALLGVLLARVAPDSGLRIDYEGIVRTLLITQMLPLASGLVIRHGAPGLTHRIAKPVGLLANVQLLALVGRILAARHETLAAIRPRGWKGMSLLLLASLGIGWFCGGLDAVARKAMAVTTATRNVAVGLVIVTSQFAGTPAVTAVVAYGLISTIGALGFALLLVRSATMGTRDARAGPSR